MAAKADANQPSLAELMQQMEALKGQAAQQVGRQLEEIESTLTDIGSLVGIEELAAKVKAFPSLKNLLVDLVRDDLSKAEPEKKAASTKTTSGDTRAPAKRFQHPSNPDLIYGGKGPLNEDFKNLAGIIGVEPKIANLKEYLREETGSNTGVYNEPLKPLP